MAPVQFRRMTQLPGEESSAQEARVGATAAVQKAELNFDPEKLKTARADHQIKHDCATSLQVRLMSEKEKLTREEKRFKEWEDACKELERVIIEIGRCEAAMVITELARRTLQDTAQHLRNRIAIRVKIVFNQINSDPIELGWHAERYSLHITPGNRHFAMLSGGEQTKLALAMTLAMIEEFSGLRFCVFDEPPYGVDADSRYKLADAILQAQEAPASISFCWFLMTTLLTEKLKTQFYWKNQSASVPLWRCPVMNSKTLIPIEPKTVQLGRARVSAESSEYET